MYLNVLFYFYPLFLTRTRPAIYKVSACPDAIIVILACADSLFCSSITHHWQSNTGGFDSKGGAVNLNLNSIFDSSAADCGARQDSGPGACNWTGLFFQLCGKIQWQRETFFFQSFASQGHSVEGWMCSICLPCPSSYRGLSSCCCAKVRQELQLAAVH